MDLAGLRALLELTRGEPGVKVGLIDGPVDVGGGGLRAASVRPVGPSGRQACAVRDSPECRHGTFVAGILVAERGTGAPAICPGCTLLVRPLFPENTSGGPTLPHVTPWDLATALRETVQAGAHVINLSMTAMHTAGPGVQALNGALDECARRDVVVAAAAGNDALIGSSCITRHPWVIPVAASDARGHPLGFSNLGRSISRRGLLAPGEDVASLGPGGRPATLSGTSAAAPFVTGTIALLCSLFPRLRRRDVGDVVARTAQRRRSVIPPRLNAWSAYQELSLRTERGGAHHDEVGFTAR